ncbi:unnamed protein product, partial [Closterium sp. Yama58-4]
MAEMSARAQKPMPVWRLQWCSPPPTFTAAPLSTASLAANTLPPTCTERRQGK